MTTPTDSSPAPLASVRELRPGTQAHGHKVKFDPTISLGHVLTFVSLLLAGFGTYNGMDKRITVLEEQRRMETERSADLDRRLKETLTEMRADVKEVQRSVNAVSNALAIRKGAL